MKKTTFFIIAIIIAFELNAQENQHKFDFKVGSGVSTFSTTWTPTLTLGFENEMNYKINSYFSTSVGVNYGRGDSRVDYYNHILIHNDYLLGSLNIFISPFRNNKKNNFRIGAGFSYLNLNVTDSNENTTDNTTDFWPMSVPYTSYSPSYTLEKINSGMYNVIIEDEQLVFSNYLIGGKLYFSADGRHFGQMMIGCLLKLGILL